MPNDADKAAGLPTDVEQLCGFLLRHLASELGADECPEPLAESVRVFARAAVQAGRDLGHRDHEHPTPVVHIEDRNAARVQKRKAGAETHGSQLRPTLPTVPPVSYDDPPITGRTSRGFPKPSSG